MKKFVEINGKLNGLKDARVTIQDRMDSSINTLILFQTMLNTANRETAVNVLTDSEWRCFTKGLYGIITDATEAYRDAVQGVEAAEEEVKKSCPDKCEYVPVLVPKENERKVLTIIDHVKKGGHVTCHYPIRKPSELENRTIGGAVV